jgi:peptide chain release factor 2
MVEIMPIIKGDEIETEINQSELRIDTYRSSGAGGQSVNTTDSAVRVTHLPTGLVATCQNERSQMRNKEKAMTILKGRLVKLMEDEKVEKIKELKGKREAVEWGSQIKSYVLHPYKMVKDHRTNEQTTAVDRVLNGEIKLIKN